LLTKQYQCNILIFPGAFNLTTGPAHWELLQRARAVDSQCFVLTASPARVVSSPSSSLYPPYTAWGHSTAVSPWGEVLATSDEHEALVMCDLDLEKVASMRQSIPTAVQKRNDMYRLEAV
jgi:omega-amidase